MTSSDVHVRPAAAQDVGSLVVLMEAFYAEAGYPLDRAWAESSFMQLLCRPELGCILIADRDGEPVGHAVLTVRYTMEHGGLCGHVDDLFVRGAFRRGGVANALMAALFEECRARDCKAVVVEVGRENSAGRRLYGRFGLRPQDDGRLLLCGAVTANTADAG